jgi:hypothetical protein
MEQQETEAKVIEDGVERLNGAEALMARLRDRAESSAAQFAGMTFDEQVKRPMKENKALRASLNGEIKSIKQEFSDAISPFERMIAQAKGDLKATIGGMTEAEALLKQVIDAQDAEEKDLKRQGLKSTYEDYAGALADLIPFERIEKREWLNKTFKATKACEEIYQIVDKIAADWDTLKAQAPTMPFYEAAEAKFFETCGDLGAAMAENARLVEKQRQVAELQAVVEANRAAGESPVTVIEHEPIKEVPEPEQPTQRTEYQLIIMLSDPELAALKDFIKGNGVGEVVRFMRRK